MRVPIVAFGEVAVKGSDDRVGSIGVVGVACPLADTRATGIGQDYTADFLESLKLSIPCNGEAELFGTGGYRKFRLNFKAFLSGLPSDGSCTVEVFVGRVGTGANQAYFQLLRISIFFYGLGKFGNRPGEVGRIRTIYMGFQARKVNFDNLVEILLRISVAFGISGKVFPYGIV